MCSNIARGGKLPIFASAAALLANQQISIIASMKPGTHGTQHTGQPKTLLPMSSPMAVYAPWIYNRSFEYLNDFYVEHSSRNHLSIGNPMCLHDHVLETMLYHRRPSPDAVRVEAGNLRSINQPRLL